MKVSARLCGYNMLQSIQVYPNVIIPLLCSRIFTRQKRLPWRLSRHTDCPALVCTRPPYTSSTWHILAPPSTHSAHWGAATPWPHRTFGPRHVQNPVRIRSLPWCNGRVGKSPATCLWRQKRKYESCRIIGMIYYCRRSEIIRLRTEKGKNTTKNIQKL